MPALPCVTHEWARLRHVVVGRPHYRIPLPLPPEREDMVSPALWRRARRVQGMTLEEAMPASFAPCREQMDRVAALLRRRGIRVSRIPAFLPEEEAWLSSTHSESLLLFPRDPALVVGTEVFELNNADPRRRRERHPFRRLLRRRIPAALGRVASMPFPDPPESRGEEWPQLDGGDCLVAGRTVLVGISPGGSNPAGARWLRRRLGSGWTVREVAYEGEFPHLDCALCLVRPGLGLFAPDALPGGPPKGQGRWRWIEVEREEALKGMAANGLQLDAGTLLLPSAATATAAALRRAGHTVVAVPFDAVTGFGGGLRCWTQPLGRWD
ncbi:MAG: hypothetical protein FIA95_16625 [Gemmatimonadetes bacterium]|nr:hypothetical protein [Gemmatimonadota bacterium]